MSLFTSILNAFSGDKAAKTQERAANAANALVDKQYQQTRSDLTPFREAGTNALSMLANASGVNGQQGYDTAFANFRSDPGYKFAVDEGLNAATASQASRGIFNSGGTLRALQDRGQGMADQGYNTYLGRLRDLMTSGQNAAAQTGTFGAQAAGQRADLTNQAGAYKAQQALMPAMGWQQFMNDIKSGAGAFAGGAFG